MNPVMTREIARHLPIGPMGGSEGLRRTGTAEAGEAGDGGFAARLGQALDGVDAEQQGADATVAAFVAGEDVPVHRVMIELTRADLAVPLTSAVTSKVLEAYQEIARMQV